MSESSRSIDGVTEDVTVLRGMDPSRNTSQGSWQSREGESTTEADTPKVLKQRFVLEERIGSGGMGTVFRAKDLRKVEARDRQPHLAIKVLNNDFRTHPEAFIALEREASKSQSLRHSNIVSIFDFDKDQDVPFITMELLEGRELAEVLQSYPNGLPADLAWSTIEGMVLGLAHAHSEGVVHADFKPGNVYLTDRSTTKILDFGIARAMRLNHGGEDTDFDPSRLAALTPAYASREMLNGDNPEPRDDLYSLGVVIYMVLTGHHPFGRVPAHDAAKENLRPERIRSISRRRWRMLERCLAFNRQHRPASAEEVYDALFGKVPWRLITLAAVLGTLALGLSLSALVDSAELDEVKQEVRQETLVDAQIARVSQLVAEPRFNASWRRQLHAELQTLRTLAPQHPQTADLGVQVQGLYKEYVVDADTLPQAIVRLDRAAELVNVDAAREAVLERMIGSGEALLEQPVDDGWIADFQALLSLSERKFPDNPAMWSLRVDLIDHVRSSIEALLADGDLTLAADIWREFEAQIFDAEVAQRIAESLDSALTVAAKQDAQRIKALTYESLQQDLEGLLTVSCLRLDMGLIGGRVRDLAARHPQHAKALRSHVATRVSQCVGRLGELDPDRAIALQAEARGQLGDLPALRKAAVDPCSLHYLVGNGREAGRRGYCADRIGEGLGPRLVVIPQVSGSNKFALTKYEVSQQEFNHFCQASGQCRGAQDSMLPATALSVEMIEAYAAWLSERTGYRYRLPTLAEWQLAAAVSAPDPNRNCTVDLAGVSRGRGSMDVSTGAANDYGLIHLFGNAQELVSTDTGYAAAGGAYRDPLEQCAAQTVRPATELGDEATGFRLLRELS